jgi:predicted 3-demethylubiquinone-9 3-methyltransferase (glyoxalase superfamily)
MQKKVSICLWFDGNAEEAVNFYVATFANSKIVSVTRAPAGGPMPAGSVLVMNFELEGVPFIALNGGPLYKFSEAISISVSCETQDEVDALWERLTSDGGQAGPCAWLKDKFGLSWQIVPRILPELLMCGDAAKSARVFGAMMQMTKIDIAKLKAAAAG